MLMALSLLVILLNVADNYTTFMFIHATQGQYIVVEGNPVMRLLIGSLGLKGALVFEMAALTFIATYIATTKHLARKVRFWTLVVLALLPLWAVFNNLQVAITLDIPIF